jgi:hypothetical protein
MQATRKKPKKGPVVPQTSEWVKFAARKLDKEREPFTATTGKYEFAYRCFLSRVWDTTLARGIDLSLPGSAKRFAEEAPWGDMVEDVFLWHREAMALKPARFHPGESSLMVEGRPVQAASSSNGVGGCGGASGREHVFGESRDADGTGGFHRRIRFSSAGSRPAVLANQRGTNCNSGVPSAEPLAGAGWLVNGWQRDVRGQQRQKRRSLWRAEQQCVAGLTMTWAEHGVLDARAVAEWACHGHLVTARPTRAWARVPGLGE